MKSRIQVVSVVLLFGLVVFQAQAAFTSLYVFGDTVSVTTTNFPSNLATNYYGGRYSNGRTWVELLAQELNLTNNYWYSNSPATHLSYTNLSASSTNWSYSSNNSSYFDHDSGKLVTELNSFNPPNGVSNALFVVWANDADLFDDIYYNNDGTDLSKWTNDINLSMTNHWMVITNLYAKGVRALLMPNAVDMGAVPFFSAYPQTNFIRQECINYNMAFKAMLSNATVSRPDLKIYEPDFFSLLENMLTNAAAYGLTNALYGGHTVDAVDADSHSMLPNLNLNGPGANYIFWDYLDPTAKASAVMADLAKQLIAPAQIGQIISRSGTNQLNLANVPVGLNGLVQSCTNLASPSWTSVTNFPSTNDTLSVFVPASGLLQFYRLNFPFSWTWP